MTDTDSGRGLEISVPGCLVSAALAFGLLVLVLILLGG